MASLKGICGQCGLCCQDGDAHCINLIQSGDKMKCVVYQDREPNMPIIMLNSDGSYYHARCLHNMPEEIPLTIERGFGKGCTLEIEEE